MSEPRAWTEDEIRQKFLEHVAMLTHYWFAETRATRVEDKLTGLAFSLMAMLDGSSTDIPGFKVIPDPHPDDEAYQRKRGENWYPDDVDIAGSLHEMISRFHHPDLG